MENKKISLPTSEEIWDQYGKMIMGIAHRISKKYPFEYDELLSEGIFAVLKKLSKWDPERSTLCTYIYRCANFGMLDLCIKSNHDIPTEIFENEIESKPNWFYNFLLEVSEETRHLVKIIFEAPEELYESIKPNHPKTSQKSLRTYMIDVFDWDNEQVERAFKEVSACL